MANPVRTTPTVTMIPGLRSGNENSPPLTYQEKSYALSGKIMLSSILILFTAVILILLLHIYTRWYLLRIRRRSRRRFLIFSEEHPEPEGNTNRTSRGLDPVLLKSLPVFTHSSESHGGEVLECAVCLSEFQVNEKGRTLPGCKHSFHIECIDMWFYSHSTCPLCRSTVHPLPVSESVRIDVAPEPSDLCDSCRHADEVPSTSSSSDSSSSSSSSSSSGGGSIGIEVPPRRIEEMGFEVRSPGGGQGFKSPGSRMRSLKRMLRKDSFRFHLSGGSPNGIDLEKDGEEERIPHPPQPS